MGLFSTPEEKNQKQADKEARLLRKYGLEGLDGKNLDSVKAIASELLGTGLMDTGMKLSMTAKVEDQLQVQYQKVLMEQNWIIIRQLDEISKKLCK